ncbi:hypothetical protein KC571_03915, partial [candidate division WWE3 bacterium]|nr:hypothetical protein [candidate division WWE3 bacterium]
VGVGLSDTLVFISDQDNQAMILNDQNVGLLIQVGEAAGPNVYPSLKINDYQSVPQILDIIFG